MRIQTQRFKRHTPNLQLFKKEWEKHTEWMQTIIGIVGGFCLLYVFKKCYNDVLIPIFFIIKFYTVCGVIATVLWYRIDKRIRKDSYNLGLTFLQKSVVYGSIFMTVLILTNQWFTTSKTYHATEKILEKNLGTGRGGKRITVQINEHTTSISVHPYTQNQIESADFAKVKLQKGFWNFTLIKETTLVKK